MMKAADFFSKENKETIIHAIKQAELNTSGEIRVHIENNCNNHPLDRAVFLFHKLKMDATADRNGVLFYLAVKDKKFAILGDSGINNKVPNGFWDSIRDVMETEFKNNRFTEGLAKGISRAGEKLKEYFPYQKDDVNELSDDISFE